MKVKLKRDLFIDATLYRKNPSPTNIPAEYKDRLPKDAEIVQVTPPPKKPAMQVLRDFDEVRASEEATDKLK